MNSAYLWNDVTPAGIGTLETPSLVCNNTQEKSAFSAADAGRAASASAVL